MSKEGKVLKLLSSKFNGIKLFDEDDSFAYQGIVSKTIKFDQKYVDTSTVTELPRRNINGFCQKRQNQKFLTSVL